MAELVWTVLCQKSCLDSYTNSVSLQDILEGVILSPLGPIPQGVGDIAAPMSMHLVSLWIRSDLKAPESIQVRLVLQLPDGTALTPGEPMAGDLVTNVRLRTFMRMQALPFHGPGLYRFCIEQRATGAEKWQRMSAVPFEVQVSEPRQSQPAASIVKAPSAKDKRKASKKRKG